MHELINPILGSGVSVAAAHNQSTWVVGAEAVIQVSGTTAGAILLPVFSDATQKLGRRQPTICRRVSIQNRSSQPQVVRGNPNDNTTIDGQREICVAPGQTVTIIVILDPQDSARGLEWGLIPT